MIYYNHSENISRPANYLEPIRSTSDLDSSVNKLGVRQQSFVRSSTLAMSRKESTDYCNEFKNNTKMHNKINLLGSAYKSSTDASINNYKKFMKLDNCDLIFLN